MKAGVYVSEAKAVMQQKAKPVIKEGEALVKVSHAGICGTDMMIYFGKHPRAQAPLTMGHEFSGVIEEIRGETEFSVGDRVAVEPTLSCGTCEACVRGQFHVCKKLKLIGIDQDGGFAQHVAVPVNRLHRLPEKLSSEHAALAEPVAVAVHTVRRSRLKVGDQAVILGAGPIGLLIGMIAKRAGAKKVMISDISSYRLTKAKELGFIPIDAAKKDVVKEVRLLTDDVGADVVFEVAGNQITAKQMVETSRIQGEIVVVSVYKSAPEVNLAAMHFKEISLTTTRCYTREDFQTAIDLLANGEIAADSLISHKLPLEDIQAGFEFMQRPDESLKVLFAPNGEGMNNDSRFVFFRW